MIEEKNDNAVTIRAPELKTANIMFGFSYVLFGILCVISFFTSESQSNKLTCLIFFCSLIALFLLIHFGFYLYKRNVLDVFTSEKYIRTTKGKVIMEIPWENVEQVIYLRHSIKNYLTMILSFSLPGHCLIYLREGFEYDLNGNKAHRVLMNMYTKKQIEEISQVIPIKIDVI